MAKYWLYSDIRDKVLRDLDLEAETFITPEEMLGYCNEAIDEVERQIHTLYEDYFLSRATIDLVAGTEEYALPDDIYAMKIRSAIYRNGNTVWPIKRIRDWRKFENYEVEKTSIPDNSRYGFFILNSNVGAPRILIAPTPNESGAFVKLWYIRNANEMVDESSVCDIPEAVNYIIQYIKKRCWEKEGHPNLQQAMMDLETEKATTLAVLSNMIPDNENEIEPDYRLYEEMV